jgi:hypothetical protein
VRSQIRNTVDTTIDPIIDQAQTYKEAFVSIATNQVATYDNYRYAVGIGGGDGAKHT